MSRCEGWQVTAGDILLVDGADAFISCVRNLDGEGDWRTALCEVAGQRPFWRQFQGSEQVRRVISRDERAEAARLAHEDDDERGELLALLAEVAA